MAVRIVPEYLRQQYLRTVITVQVDEKIFSASDALKRLSQPLYVITAANPREKLSEAENDARNEELLVGLIASEFKVYPAVGVAPDGTWHEKGWAVVGLTRRAARAIGRDWDQDVVFELRDAEQSVLGCFSQWRRSRPLEAVISPTNRGENLDSAVQGALGVVVRTAIRRADALGWTYDGDLHLPCPNCDAPLHLFGADLRSKTGTPYRSMIFVCPQEAAVRLPSQVPDTYREVAKRWRDFVQASRDADDFGLTDRTAWAYVIELSNEAADDEMRDLPAVYVGQTGHTPEERLEQHRAGYKSSPWVRKFGRHLRPDLYLPQPVLRNQAEALAYEAYLFAHLRAYGYPAKGGH